MLANASSLQSPEPCSLSRLIAARLSIWQIGLLDAQGLDSFSSDRGLMSFFLGRFIREIWQAGLLNADLVSSPNQLNIDGLTLIKQDQYGNYAYADERILMQRNSGWSNALEEIEPISSEVELFFHPFRYYVLYHIDRLLEINTSPIQMLSATERYSDMLISEIERFQRLTAESKFAESVNTWNRNAALFIATEPYFFERLFRVIKYSPFESPELQRQKMKDHWNDVAKCYMSLGLNHAKELHQELCLIADLLDPNKNVHTMLRLTRGESRLNQIKGNLGGAMYILTMAEMVRRATEEVFQTKLQEEDESGFGFVPHGVKENLYGAERLLDADRNVKNQYVRMFGLNYGLSVRWYVEGDTELNAIQSILGKYNAIDMINLRGQVAARGGKGVAFRDSLRSDLKSHIFSFVSIDGDQSDHLRAVRKAAEDDEICGMFFVSDPDFEFANFNMEELEEILWSVAVDLHTAADKRSILHDSISGVKSAKEMFTSIQSTLPDLSQYGKGKAWGERLMAFAWEKPETKIDPASKSKMRPIVEAIEFATRAVDSHYLRSRTNTKVDPTTGRPVKRPK